MKENTNINQNVPYEVATLAIPDGFQPITVDLSARVYADADLMKSAKALRKNLSKSEGADLENLYIIQTVANGDSWRADGFRAPVNFIMEELGVKQAYAYRLLQASRYVKRFPDGKVHTVFKPYFAGEADFTASQLRDIMANKAVKEHPEIIIAIIESGVITPATKRAEIDALINKALTPAVQDSASEALPADSTTVETPAEDKQERSPKQVLLDSLYNAIGAVSDAGDVACKSEALADAPDYVTFVETIHTALDILRTAAARAEEF